MTHAHHDHGHSHDHAHEHAPDHSHGGHHHGPVDTGDWRYAVGLVVNLAFVGIEFGAGVFSGSTALMADAGHNMSDVLGLARLLTGWRADHPDYASSFDPGAHFVGPVTVMGTTFVSALARPSCTSCWIPFSAQST